MIKNLLFQIAPTKWYLNSLRYLLLSFEESTNFPQINSFDHNNCAKKNQKETEKSISIPREPLVTTIHFLNIVYKTA